ncbi:hypothetical protein [Labrenzia sp. CE80]|uniref:hypothetical protein n=1 Tax=Labrenzia sp. CE80 TaxID=1788986 RepID=UPI00129B905E|nr:hypothetical protein [Labrenzia sp. CE80]
MIEAAMYIALGFFLATLLAAAIFPAIYKRAVRLTQEAMKAVNPASFIEVRAAQDVERAKYALALRKAERLAENERQNSAKHRLEAGRLTADMVKMQTSHAQELSALKAELEDAQKKAGGRKARSSALATELEKTRARLAETEQALAAARADADLLKKAEPVAAWAPSDDMMALTTITGLEAQIATLKGQLARTESGAHSDQASDPLLQTNETELRAMVAKLETNLVDAETQYISAQAEVTRLSLILDQSKEPTDDKVQKLQRDLKWAENEKARLTAIVHDRERTLERAKAQVGKLRQDLRSAPELASVRSELAALTAQISSGRKPAATGKAKPVKAAAQPGSSKAVSPSSPATAGKTAKPASKPSEAAIANANALVNRIVRSSRANADQSDRAAPTEAPIQKTPGAGSAQPQAPNKKSGEVSTRPTTDNGAMAETKAAAKPNPAKRTGTPGTKKRDVA